MLGSMPDSENSNETWIVNANYMIDRVLDYKKNNPMLFCSMGLCFGLQDWADYKSNQLKNSSLASCGDILE